MKCPCLKIALGVGVLALAALATQALVNHWQHQPESAPGPQVVASPENPVGQPQPPAPLENRQSPRGPVADYYTLSAPHSHGNLTVFLVHGPSTLTDAKFITLSEAINKGLAIVHETRTNTLQVENRSNQELFLQSGDIIKGGTQDRTIPHDILISSNSGRTPVNIFCVEEGRSGPRGAEPASHFSGAKDALPSKDLRMAALHGHNQMEVWNAIRRTQSNLTQNLGAPVNGPASPTSLQLTLESPSVQKSVQAPVDALAGVLDDTNDVIGCAVAINGKVHCIDIYASSELFRAAWPRLLRGAAIASLTERAQQDAPAATGESIERLLTNLDSGTFTQRQVSNRILLVQQETAEHVCFDTCDKNRGNLVLHRCILVK
ncbi:MAG: hypothetical protein L0215_22765 [Gemmataceae bacterium]|nr:hypothetical protein [Gemmataceae bacterium]